MAKVRKLKPGQKGREPSGLPGFVARSKGCVLFVDDDELINEVGQEMLACLGYEAVGQTSSVEALEGFREAPHRFDLVVTDLNMPDMKGDTLAQQLWDIRPDIPVILCTGNNTMTREKARTRGFDVLLTKPFGVHDMAAAIVQALQHGAAHRM